MYGSASVAEYTQYAVPTCLYGTVILFYPVT
jgi:hypothetical protein